MEIDALGDTIPSRYAVESDEEDEFHPLQQSTSSQITKSVSVQVSGQPLTGVPLLVVMGHAAHSWVKGVHLGDQRAVVVLNGVQVGFIFYPPWTRAAVLVSEVTTRLPSWAMHSYAESIIATLKPAQIALLDIYSVSQYIDTDPSSGQQAPVRYLSTTDEPTLDSMLRPFAPPNVLQSSSASFVLLSALTSSRATLILLPFPHSLPPPISELSPHGLGKGVTWHPTVINHVHKQLFHCLHEQPQTKWEPNSTEERVWMITKRDAEPLDGGMYI